jgi:hypothetical protein
MARLRRECASLNEITWMVALLPVGEGYGQLYMYQ